MTVISNTIATTVSMTVNHWHDKHNLNGQLLTTTMLSLTITTPHDTPQRKPPAHRSARGAVLRGRGEHGPLQGPRLRPQDRADLLRGHLRQVLQSGWPPLSVQVAHGVTPRRGIFWPDFSKSVQPAAFFLLSSSSSSSNRDSKHCVINEF